MKAAYRIGQVQDIGRGVARAIRTATSGRPGGVYLDIPGDVLGQAVEASAASGAIWRPVDPAPRLLPAPEAIDRALDVLAQAQRPLLVLGKGAAYAQADNVIREFVEHTGIPFLPMSMAKGLLPDSHPQSAAAARSLAMARADVVLLFFQAEDGIRDYKVDWSSDVCSSDLGLYGQQKGCKIGRASCRERV